MTPDLILPFLAAVALIPMPALADSRAPSPLPPADLAVAEVPQFVMIGFDDNPDVAPLRWILDHAADLTNPAGRGQAATFDGSPVRFAFYSNTKYLDSSRELSELHHAACQAGHEIGNHTHNHFHGGDFTPEQWFGEMNQCRQGLAKAGIPSEQQYGFRTPFLEYNDHTFAAARQIGFTYDTSIEEGYQSDQDGTNFLWPYTLDEGSPGNRATTAPHDAKRVSRHPGLWEIPLHVFMVPPDDRAADYGIEPGLADRMAAYIQAEGGWEWPRESRKISGLDWNVFEAAGRDGPEFLAILKHTLDLRLAGNRAPLMVGGHTALFPTDKPGRRAAMEEFLAYALQHPQVRIVTPMQLIGWLRNPVASQP